MYIYIYMYIHIYNDNDNNNDNDNGGNDMIIVHIKYTVHVYDIVIYRYIHILYVL